MKAIWLLPLLSWSTPFAQTTSFLEPRVRDADWTSPQKVQKILTALHQNDLSKLQELVPTNGQMRFIGRGPYNLGLVLTPLDFALQVGTPAAARLIEEKGYALSVVSDLKVRHPETLRYFWKKVSKSDQRSMLRNARTPAHVEAALGAGARPIAAAGAFLRLRDSARAIELLEQYHLDPFAKVDGQTLVMHAIWNSDVEFLTAALKRAPREKLHQAMELAMKKRDPTLVKLLLRFGATPLKSVHDMIREGDGDLAELVIRETGLWEVTTLSAHLKLAEDIYGIHVSLLAKNAESPDRSSDDPHQYRSWENRGASIRRSIEGLSSLLSYLRAQLEPEATRTAPVGGDAGSTPRASSHRAGR